MSCVRFTVESFDSMRKIIWIPRSRAGSSLSWLCRLMFWVSLGSCSLTNVWAISWYWRLWIGPTQNYWPPQGMCSLSIKSLIWAYSVRDYCILLEQQGLGPVAGMCHGTAHGRPGDFTEVEGLASRPWIWEWPGLESIDTYAYIYYKPMIGKLLLALNSHLVSQTSHLMWAWSLIVWSILPISCISCSSRIQGRTSSWIWNPRIWVSWLVLSWLITLGLIRYWIPWGAFPSIILKLTCTRCCAQGPQILQLS